MINPIKIGKELQQAYLNYIDANIPLPDEKYVEERTELLRKDGVLFRSPIIELVKQYKPIDTIDNVAKDLPFGKDISDFLNTGLLKSPIMVHSVALKVTSIRPLQLEKAELPMLVTELGMMILVRSLHLSNI